MRFIRPVCVAVLLASPIVSARTAADLKAALATIIPSGKQARLAYVKGGSPQAFPTNATGTAVYGVSSVDGVIRRIYPASGSGSYNCVNFTADGTRIVVYENNSRQVHVVNWDGSLVRSFSVGGQLLDYWIKPSDKTEWAVVMSNGISRVNIANPTAAAVQVVSSNPGDDGALISDDGTKMVMYNSGNIGLRAVLPATGWTGASDGGCWPQMRAGTPIMFSENNSNHTALLMYNASAGSAGTIATTSVLRTWITADAANRSLSGCSDGETAYASDGHRWTRERDYFTFFCNSAKVNPILFRATDSKFIHIEDNLTCTFCGDMDMVTGTWSSTEISGNAMIRRSALTHGAQDARIYSFDGRLVGRPDSRAGSGNAYKGVMISQSSNGAAVKLFR